MLGFHLRKAFYHLDLSTRGELVELILSGGLIRVWSPGGSHKRVWSPPWGSQKRVSLSRVFRAGYLICAAQFQMKKIRVSNHSEFQQSINLSVSPSVCSGSNGHTSHTPEVGPD